MYTILESKNESRLIKPIFAQPCKEAKRGCFAHSRLCLDAIQTAGLIPYRAMRGFHARFARISYTAEP